ncbi:Uncharacterized protein APZ42_033309 [Daphnia magna]|uniref:Uncharacterized protein n=1 Tax=Daphnia magna TaxID=35525 RepID=A0A0P6GDC5_9CRUS|nr:Uncharacterized protein APZ42_033309 [Daphnia magna]
MSIYIYIYNCFSQIQWYCLSKKKYSAIFYLMCNEASSTTFLVACFRKRRKILKRLFNF